WRCCQSRDLRLHSSGSAPSNSSSCSAQPGPRGSWAIRPPGCPLSRYATYRGSDARGVGEDAVDLLPTVLALAPRLDIADQSATAQVPCETDPNPMPCSNTCGHGPSTLPRSSRAPDS